MITSRIIGGALAAIVAATSAVAVAAPATSSKVGKFDVYADALRAGKFNTFTDGARQGKFDPYSEGTRQGQFDSFSEGARAPSGEIAASSLDNARSGDGSLYGYRV